MATPARSAFVGQDTSTTQPTELGHSGNQGSQAQPEDPTGMGSGGGSVANQDTGMGRGGNDTIARDRASTASNQGTTTRLDTKNSIPGNESR